jgi:sialidase-1
MDMILMEFADPYKNSDYDKGVEPVEILNHERVAAHYQLPSINLAREVHDKIVNHEFEWAKDFKDLHPAMFGQQLYARTIQSLLDACYNDYQHGVKQIKKHPLPVTLNRFSFTNGSYVDVGKAHFANSWILTPDWTPADVADTRPGFVHVPVLESTQANAELTFSFNGDAVGVAFISGPDAGMIDYAIDGQPYRRADLFTEWSGGLHLPWYLLLGSGLADGGHQLHIKILSEKNKESKGNACRIVHFLCNK